MRRHAKAPTAAATRRRAMSRNRFGHGGSRLLLAAALAALTLILGVALAGAAAPVVSVEDASNVRYTTAHVEGEVNPEDHETSWHFDYVSQAQFEASEWAEASSFGFGSVGAGEPPVKPSEELGGLTPGATYHLRLVAENSEAERVEAIAANTFETEAVAKPSLTIDPVSGTPADEVDLSGTVNPNSPQPEGSTDTAEQEAFRSNWHFECTPDCGSPSGPPVEADDSAHVVEAKATGLQPNTTYTVKLIASNAGGSEEATESAGQPIEFSTAAAPPTLTQPGNTPLGQSEFGVGAFVTPRNSEVTDCHFDWGPTAAYGQSAPCLDEADQPLGPIADNSAHLVKGHLGGLAPGATYHYRLSVTTALGGTVTSDDGHLQALSIPSEEGCANPNALGAPQLPDCRAWEMVTPPDKNGADAIPDTTRTRAAADGSAIDFHTLGAFGDTEGTDVSTEYIAERSADPDPGDSGWSSHSVSFNQKPNAGQAIFSQFHSGYLGELSSDLNRGVSLSFTPLTPDPLVADVPNLYLRTDLRQAGPGAGYRLLTPCPGCGEPLAPPPANILGKRLEPHFAWNSPDFSHVIFESKQPLTADTPESPGCGYTNPFASFLCRTHLYEWANGTLRLAGRVPATPATSCDDEAGPPCVGADFSVAGAGTGDFRGSLLSVLAPQALSDGSDGHSRVFFTQPTDAEGHTSEELGNSVFINEFAYEAPPWRGKLFMRLDGAATVQLNASERTDCAADPSCGGNGAPDPAPAEFAPAYFLDASRNGDRFFFASPEALTDDATQGGFNLYMYEVDKPASDPHNLTLLGQGERMFGVSADGHYAYFEAGGAIYLWHEGELDHVISAADGAALSASFGGGGQPGRARVSPDGRHLLFVSSVGQGLLSSYGGSDYDQSASEKECEVERCKEFYLYSADTDTLACASCGPSGASPDGDALGFVVEHVAASFQAWARNHTLSADGRFVFFSSPDRLVAADHNSPCPPTRSATSFRPCTDAYRYDSLSGQIDLLSSGDGAEDSYFLDASADGRNAFLITREALSGWDVDTSYDIYDARVGGGFPEPSPPPPSCQGDACQPAPNLPRDPNVASSAFAGAGNQARRRRARCRANKRRVRRDGRARCVAKHHRKHKRDANANRRAGR